MAGDEFEARELPSRSGDTDRISFSDNSSSSPSSLEARQRITPVRLPVCPGSNPSPSLQIPLERSSR
jgi:hypothetical protein